jgi:hypothetical protein
MSIEISYYTAKTDVEEKYIVSTDGMFIECVKEINDTPDETNAKFEVSARTKFKLSNVTSIQYTESNTIMITNCDGVIFEILSDGNLVNCYRKISTWWCDSFKTGKF